MEVIPRYGPPACFARRSIINSNRRSVTASILFLAGIKLSRLKTPNVLLWLPKSFPFVAPKQGQSPKKRRRGGASHCFEFFWNFIICPPKCSKTGHLLIWWHQSSAVRTLLRSHKNALYNLIHSCHITPAINGARFFNGEDPCSWSISLYVFIPLFPYL